MFTGIIEEVGQVVEAGEGTLRIRAPKILVDSQLGDSISINGVDLTVALADYKDANPTGVPKEMENASLIARGEYLTHAADCVACHTAKNGGQPFAGGLAFNLPNIGTIYSTNITPDAARVAS